MEGRSLLLLFDRSMVSANLLRNEDALEVNEPVFEALDLCADDIDP